MNNKEEEEAFRKLILKIVKEKGEEAAKAQVGTSELSTDKKEKAFKIIEGDRKEEVVLAEHGDISDLGGGY